MGNDDDSGVDDANDDVRWTDLGAFIQGQRRSAELSLRKLADLTGVSNPYLSQIERGLRRPSAEILQQIAKALHLSAETLYVRAGLLDETENAVPNVIVAIKADPDLSPKQRDSLITIYESFRNED